MPLSANQPARRYYGKVELHSYSTAGRRTARALVRKEKRIAFGVSLRWLHMRQSRRVQCAAALAAFLLGACTDDPLSSGPANPELLDQHHPSALISDAGHNGRGFSKVMG